MRRTAKRCLRPGLGGLCALLVALAVAAPAGAASQGPVFVYTPAPHPLEPPVPPPWGYFEGPCGLAVDSEGDYYISDYYHDTVEAFSSRGGPYHGYLNRTEGIDPLDGPCGLAVDAEGDLYVNDYHRAVFKVTPSVFPPPPPGPFPPPTVYGSRATLDTAEPTGVAIGPADGTVYVDDRTYVAAYRPDGEPLESGGEPLRIGQGSIGDGYGLAVSGFEGDSEHASTAGYVYVPDAAAGVIQVFDPAAGPLGPVRAIGGSEVPGGGFSSLRDAAVAVDDTSGDVYVVDNLQPGVAEHPEAAIYVFGPDGTYLGRLEYNVYDGSPTGIAVDNSETATAGRVYVTSGNSEIAGVVAYAPGSEGDVALPAGQLPGAELYPPTASAATVETAATRSAAAVRQSAASPAAVKASPGATASEVAQKGGLRVALSGGFSPRALPRSQAAPVAVTVGGRITTANGGEPPQLRRIRIEFNRHGRLDTRGLPACRRRAVEVASSARALQACRPALVGRGSFSADIVLAGQEPYPTKGRLLLFNARSHGKAALLGQIYAAHPFATSFLIPFEVRHSAKGTYGTTIEARLPKALGDWGYVTAISLKLARRYSYRGRSHSFLAAACAAPKGFPGALFPLARTSFVFAGGKTLRAAMTRSCRVRG